LFLPLFLSLSLSLQILTVFLSHLK
jgi:hypothetical protein